MLSLLSNWKLYILSLALIGALSLNVVQRFTISSLENDKLQWQGKYAALEAAINISNQLAKEQEKDLRLREQEAAKARAESLKRMDEIMQDVIPGGCDGATRYGIEKAQELKFIWNNTIP